MRTGRVSFVGVTAAVALLMVAAAALRTAGGAPDESDAEPGSSDSRVSLSPADADGAVDDADREPRDGTGRTERAGDEPAEPAHEVLRVWIPGGFDPALLERAAALPHVVLVTLTRSDTVGLIGARDTDGRVVDAPAEGYQIPVAVTAIDPQATAALADARDPGAGAVLGALRPGEVLLTEAAARVRGVGAGAALDLRGRSGLRVAGVVPDDALPRAEIAVHEEEAEALGLPAGGAITVLHDAPPGPETDALIDALADLAPAGATARVSQPYGARRVPLVLSLPELKAAFGEFAYRAPPGERDIDIDPTFVAEHIVSAHLPVLGTVQCHRRIVENLRAALEELVDAGLGEWIDPVRYGGCFHARRVRADRDRLSSHSWGAAIDINVDLSMPGLGPAPPEEMIEIFGRHGFRWGGDFTTPDHHHWEWVGDHATMRHDR